MKESGIPPGSEFAYEVGVLALDRQSRLVDALDNKAAVMLAVDGVLAGLLFQKGTVVQSAPKPLASLAILVLVGSFLAALRAFSTKKYAVAPQLSAVTGWVARDEAWLRWRFLGNMQEAEAENSKKLQRKVRWLSWSVRLLFLEVSMSGGYLLWIM